MDQNLNYDNWVKKAFSYLIIPVALRKHALLKASMLQDIENGKKTEVDSINGSVCTSPSFDNMKLFGTI